MSEEFQGSSRAFLGSFERVPRVFERSSKEVSKKCYRNFEGVSRKFKRCFKKVSWVLQQNLGVSRVFHG